MTPEQAMTIIKNVQQLFNAPGKDHIVIAQAIQVLDQLIQAAKAAPPPKDV